MGVEEWEVKYKLWSKGSLNEFLDKGECDLGAQDSRPNKTICFTRSSQDSMISKQPVKPKVKTSLNPYYPEGYNTIDRRLRKKVRDPVGIANTRTEFTEEDLFNSDLALLRQKRGELVLRQVAEMQEEDEKMMPCLRPYKNGLFYKSRIQAKNTRRDYSAYQDEEETRLSIDPNSEDLDELQGSEEEFEELCSEISQPYKHYKKDSSFSGCSEKLQGYRDRKAIKGKTGEWTPEIMLSPVEEPSDEYVDPMDELQCLVETVSEYLAEKEEEISKYGSLPEPSKSRLSSQGGAITESFGDEEDVTTKGIKEDEAIEVKDRNLSQQASGKKNTMNSLFSSLSCKIIPSSKQTRPNYVQCSEESDYAVGSSGLSKLLSFVTRSPGPAPVAVVSPTQETPPDKNFPMPTLPPVPKPRGIQKTPPTSKTQAQNNTVIINQNESEFNPSESSELRQANYQSFFLSKGVDGTSKIPSEEDSRNELCSTHSADHSNNMQKFRPSGGQTKTATETQTKTEHNKPISQKPTEDLGFFSPLKKSFTSLVSPVPRVPPQHQTQTVFPVFGSENDVRVAKILDTSSHENKMDVTLLDSVNVPTKHPPKTEITMFSGLLEVASGDDCGEPKSPSQTTVKSGQTAPSKSDSVCKVSLNSDKAKSPSQNLPETQPRVTLETSWFSSLFKTVPNEHLQTVSPQRFMKQSSQPPSGSSQNTVRSETEKSLRAVSEQTRILKKTPDTPSTEEPNTSRPETRRLHSTLFKSSTSGGTPCPNTGWHPVEGGLFSGIMKFVSAGDVSKGTQSKPVHPENKPCQINPAQTYLETQLHTQQVHKPSSSRVPSASAKEPSQHRDNTDCQLSQKSLSPQQASSQQESMLSGLLRLVSNDSLSNNQDKSWRHQNVPTNAYFSNQPSKQSTQGHQSRISNDQPDRQKVIEECSNQSDSTPQPASEQKGFFSDLLKFPSNNLPTTPCASTQQQLKPKNSRQSSLESKSTDQYHSVAQEDSQSGILSGIFYTSRASSEEVEQCKEVQQSLSRADMGLDKATNGIAMFAPRSQRCNGTVEHNVPVYHDDNNLDLRTLARNETSHQMNVTCISNTIDSSPQMSKIPDSSFLTPVKNLHSTDNHPSSPVGLVGQVQTVQPYLTQSNPSIYSYPEQHAHHNNSFYGLAPIYEHSWRTTSVQRELTNNQAMSLDPWEYRHAKSLEALLELSMDVDENHQYNSTHKWMAFNNSQENSLKQQEDDGSIASHLHVQNMWNSHNMLDMINNRGSCIKEGGALNLSKKSNPKYGSCQSFSGDSCYSLNSVTYLEGYYEEHPTNLSYSANRENIYTNTYRQPASNECYPNGWNYTSAATADMEDYPYFEDSEWYHQWLLLLEQGMWWPADDGNCGYFIYTDHEYIYALLTDESGQYVYACAPDNEAWGNGQMPDNYPGALLHNEMVKVCGFKIPLYNEDELFWFPGEDQSGAQLLNAPLDLSDAYRRGNEIMNLNLERFSQMFESSILSQKHQAMDFSLYQLNKVKMDTRNQTQNSFANQDSIPEVLDLSVSGTNYSLNNRITKEVLSKKVSISTCPTPTTHSSGVYNCYQPHQRRCSSSRLQVKHIDDTSEEEWRKIVQPGEEQPKPIKKISSFFSSLVGKSQESESHRNIIGSKMFTTAINDKHPEMIEEKSDKSSVLEGQSKIKSASSAGIPGIKSIKSIKNDAASSATFDKSTNSQTLETGPSRILPEIPSSVSAQGVTHKPKLAGQATVSQQSSLPDVSTNITNVPTKSLSSIERQNGERPSEYKQGGFLSFFRNAIGIEEPSQESGVKDSSTDKSMGMTKPLGSVQELLNMEHTTTQLPSEESYLQRTSKATSYVDHKTEKIQKPQRQSRFSLGSQSDIPQASRRPEEQVHKTGSQILLPDVNDGLISCGSHTVSPTSSNKSEPSTKTTSGLFGFSVGISGDATNKEETAGRGLLSMFSDFGRLQVPPQSESASQCQVGGESAKNTTGNRIFSLFGSSSTDKTELSTTEKAPQKETSSIGIFSLFNTTSTQQSSTGSLFQASSLKEAQGIKVLKEFSATKPQQNSSPSRSTSKQSSLGIAQQDPPNTASQETGSLFGGILGNLNESPVKSLFSRFGGSSPQPTFTPQPTSGPGADAVILEKMPPKQLHGSEIIDDEQNAKTCIQINAQANQSPEACSNQNEQSSKSSVKCLPLVTSVPTPQQRDYIDPALADDTVPVVSPPNQGPSIPLLAKLPDKGMTSMLSEVPFQANEAPDIQTCASVPKDITTDVDTISVPLEATSTLPTPSPGSGPEVSSLNTAAGLFSMFSGSGSQNSNPQAGSVLGGIFSGTTGQKNIPGKSLFSMLSSPNSKSSSDADDHGKEPPGKSLFSMFSGTKLQPSTSILGGFFPGDVTPKEVSGSGLLSMFGGPSPTPPSSQTEATLKPPEAKGPFNDSLPLSLENTSKDLLFSEEKNLDLQNSQVMTCGHSEVDQKMANTVPGDGIKDFEANELMILQLQSASSEQQNICHFITEAETMDGKATTDTLGIVESPALSGELVSSTCTLPKQNEQQNLSQNEIHPQPKQDDMTIAEPVIAEKEGQHKAAGVGKSVFDTTDVVSGFMSKMFSGTTEPSKTSSGLFSSAQTSFFMSTSKKGSGSQQTASLFGFASSLPTESLKSDLLGMFKSHQTVKPAETTLNLSSNYIPSTESSEFAVLDQRIPNDIVSSSGDIVLTENQIERESDLVQNLQHTVTKLPNPASVNTPEGTSVTSISNDDIIHHYDTVIMKPGVVVGEPENALTNESGPAQEPHKSEPPQSVFGLAALSPPKFSFIPESEDARKSLGSLFSSAANKGLPTMPQTDGGGLFSGIKSFSTSLFSDKKPAVSNNEPASLFGDKLGLCHKDVSIPAARQTPCADTAQPNSAGCATSTSSETNHSFLVSKEIKENVDNVEDKIIHGHETVIDLDRSEFAEQNKIIDSQNDSKLQISVSTLAVDCPSQKEQESQLQLPSPAAFSSGLQQEYKEPLSGRRLVTS